MKSHARDDEEPEFIPGDDWETFETVAGMEARNVSGSCEFCGQYGHKFVECPNRLKGHTAEGKWTDASGSQITSVG